MKVVGYKAHNVMRISDVDFDLKGRHLFLVGGDNGQGKTSALKSLLMALCGRRGCDWPEVSLKEGEDEGWVQVELTGDEDLHEPEGFTVELHLKRKRGGEVVESFRLLDSAGEEAPEPRTLLQRLFRFKGFDPLEFSRMDPGNQRRMLLELVGVDVESDDRMLATLYERRRDLNRERKKEDAKFQAMTHHNDAPSARVDINELMERLTDAQEFNQETARMQENVSDLATEQERIQTDINSTRLAIEELNKEIEQKKALIATLEDAADENHQSWQKATEMISTRMTIDEADIKEKIRTAGELNRKFDDNLSYHTQAEEVDMLNRKWRAIDDEMAKVKEGHIKALQDAEPLEDLTVDDEGVLFQGLPFHQASRSEQIIISTKIGMQLNPKLRLLVCQDGSDLGNSTLDALEELLESEDFQMVLELVTRSEADEDRCAVVIENGKTRKKK